jgi:hypothetical protein
MTQGLQYEAVPGEQNLLSIHFDADWGTDPTTGVVALELCVAWEVFNRPDQCSLCE